MATSFVRFASSYVFTVPSPTEAHHEAARTRRKGGAGQQGTDHKVDPSASPADGVTRDSRHALVDEVNREYDLYKVLGLPARTAKVDEIRRAYIARSRICHPDKFPDYPAATPAFQKLSYAYETLSRPQSRRLYDLSGRSEYSPSAHSKAAGQGFGDETLHGVLQAMLADFIEGDFEMIRVFVNALNEGQPGLNLGDETVENLEGVFRRLREILLAGHRYLRVVKFELIRLYEIQHSLRSLSYFDITGRLRLTLQLARVTLAIPMAVDKAMREDAEREALASADPQALAAGRGLLNKRVAAMLGFAVAVLERGEKFTGREPA